MSITSSGRGNPLDFPQELTDEIISHNQDDIEFILTASLVSKAWRDTALRHLFSKASFLCKADFTRWSTICASLPHVANYVRDINFHLASFPELEDRAMFSPGGSTARALKDTVTTRGPLEYISSFRTALDCRFPADSDFELFLPTMSNATRVYWAIPEARDGFNPLAANATRFLQAFPNVRDLSIFAPISAYTPESAHIMGFFPGLKRCEFLCGRVMNLEDACPTPAFAGDLSKLEELRFRCCGWMDWLVDDVFSKSLPPLRRIGWGFDYPAFTPAAFVRFLSMISGTLEEISIGIPTESIDWDIPEFASGAILPVLRVLTIKTHYTDSRVLPWVGSILPVFPLCPTLDRFELSCFVSDPDDITGTFVHPLMDWTSLLDDRYPSLEVVEFEMAMELDEVFDFEERTRLEAVVRDNVNIDRLAVKWGDSPREVHPWT